MSTEDTRAPGALRRWFVFHFVADMLFAVPLMIAPHWFLGLFGWEVIDPFTARLVAAALFGIGIESLLGRNASAESFRTMLRLKIIWSSAAVVGILVTMLQGAPPLGWIIFAIFAGFNLLWIYWFIRLRSAASHQGSN